MAANRSLKDGLPAQPLTPTNQKPHISEKARQRPVRVIPADDRAEMEAGHLIAAGGVFSSNMIARSNSNSENKESFGGSGSFGGSEGYGSGNGFGGAEGDADERSEGGEITGHSAASFADAHPSSSDDLT